MQSVPQEDLEIGANGGLAGAFAERPASVPERNGAPRDWRELQAECEVPVNGAEKAPNLK